MPVISLVPTQDDALEVVRTFFLAVLPAGIEVVLGQDNRVAEPVGPDFVVVTPIRRTRIETNVDAYVDCCFAGSIAGQTLTVASVNYGTLIVGATIFGVAINKPITIVRQMGGVTGGAGTYLLNAPLTVAPEQMAAGTAALLQPTEVVFQVDVYGPGSADNAQTISTTFRDEFAVDFFRNLNPLVSPLYADDPRQMPFEDDQQQVENRWMIEAKVQVNQAVTVPQQFADELKVTTIAVEVAYPAN